MAEFETNVGPAWGPLSIGGSLAHLCSWRVWRASSDITFNQRGCVHGNTSFHHDIVPARGQVISRGVSIII